MEPATTDWTIRPARGEADIAAAAAMFRDYAASLTVDLCFQGFEAELAALPGAYAPLHGELLLAAGPEGAPVGCIALRPSIEGVCEMKRLYVRPAGRGSGLGRRLAEAIIASARERGYRAMRLDTLAEMASARRLYAELGFRPIAPYYDNPHEDVAFLQLDLAG